MLCYLRTVLYIGDQEARYCTQKVQFFHEITDLWAKLLTVYLICDNGEHKARQEYQITQINKDYYFVREQLTRFRISFHTKFKVCPPHCIVVNRASLCTVFIFRCWDLLNLRVCWSRFTPIMSTPVIDKQFSRKATLTSHMLLFELFQQTYCTRPLTVPEGQYTLSRTSQQPISVRHDLKTSSTI